MWTKKDDMNRCQHVLTEIITKWWDYRRFLFSFWCSWNLLKAHMLFWNQKTESYSGVRGRAAHVHTQVRRAPTEPAACGHRALWWINRESRKQRMKQLVLLISQILHLILALNLRDIIKMLHMTLRKVEKRNVCGFDIIPVTLNK